jgi:plasmid stabilization system protein ParE
MIIVDVAESCSEALESIEDFMLARDVRSAAQRVEAAQAEILGFIELVKWHPKIGRLTGPIDGQFVKSRSQFERIVRKVPIAGLPEAREYVLSNHVIVYAHSDSRVLLLSIRHQKEFGYGPNPK